jgi:hypothetical protein
MPLAVCAPVGWPPASAGAAGVVALVSPDVAAEVVVVGVRALAMVAAPMAVRWRGRRR